MAIWTYEQNFNSLNDGNLVGQDGWTEFREGAIDALVGDYTPHEGAKCIKITNPELLSYPNNYNYYRKVINCDHGRLSMAIKLDLNVNTQAMIIITSDGADADIEIEMSMEDGVGKIFCYDFNGILDGDTGLRYEDNTWFVFEIDFNNVDNRYSVRKDKGEWVGNYAPTYYEDTEFIGEPMTLLQIGAMIEDNTSSVYFDEIKREHFGPFPSSINE